MRVSGQNLSTKPVPARRAGRRTSSERRIGSQVLDLLSVFHVLKR
jgi:hypothetical protein